MSKSTSSFAVSVHGRYNIVPATPTPQPCVRKLSNLDFLLCGNTFTKQVFYYCTPTSRSWVRTQYDRAGADQQEGRGHADVAGLKESLSHALVRYYLLAGRPERDAGAGDGRYHINCNDAGAPFLEASTQARFDDWADIRLCSIEAQLSPPQPLTADIDIAPLLQVQVTKFACGGIAIAYVVSEMVVDGHSSYEFFACWSRVHYNIMKGNFTLLECAPRPIFNLGELLEARQPPKVNNVPMRNLVKVSKVPDGCVMQDLSQYEHKRFIVAATCVDALIREIEQGPFGSYGRATSFEALSALLWKCMTQARGLPDKVVTKFAYPISFRNNVQRWCPVIPEECFGNAVHVSCLLAEAGGIKSKHISYTASLIHKDLRTVNMETIWSTIDWIQLQLEKGFLVGMDCDVFGGKDIFVASLYNFPIYHMDFGFGKPLYYSLVSLGDGVAYFLPTRDGGRNREISLTLPKLHMKKLTNDQLFQTFAKEIV